MPSGLKRIHLDETESTNNICFEELNKGHKTIIITADKQTGGRGRNSKQWFSPKGNIYFSFGFSTNNIVEGLSVKAGLKVAEILNNELGKEILLKWPNDLIYSNKKIGGILVETSSYQSTYQVVIGIGINLKIFSNFFGDTNRSVLNELITSFLSIAVWHFRLLIQPVRKIQAVVDVSKVHVFTYDCFS